MSVTELLSYLNITAMVLGYILLAVLLTAIVWMGGNWADNWRYKRRRKRQHDKDWDNLRSAWLLDMRNRPHPDDIDTIEHPQVIDSVSRIDTDVMNVTIAQITNYQKEHTRDAS